MAKYEAGTKPVVPAGEPPGDAVTPPRQAARLAALVGLARPVQHDINNLLTVVFANLEMLKRTAAAGGPQRQLDRIQEAARRFEGTTRALLAMLRRPAAGVVSIRLSDLVAAIQPLLLLLLPAPGALAVELAADDPPVLFDRAALEEALLAVAEEAADALPRGAGLRLAVAAGEAEARLLVQLPPGVALAALARLDAVANGAGRQTEEGWCLTLPAAPEPA